MKFFKNLKLAIIVMLIFSTIPALSQSSTDDKDKADKTTIENVDVDGDGQKEVVKVEYFLHSPNAGAQGRVYLYVIKNGKNIFPYSIQLSFSMKYNFYRIITDPKFPNRKIILIVLQGNNEVIDNNVFFTFTGYVCRIPSGQEKFVLDIDIETSKPFKVPSFKNSDNKEYINKQFEDEIISDIMRQLHVWDWLVPPK